MHDILFLKGQYTLHGIILLKAHQNEISESAWYFAISIENQIIC